MVSARSSTRLIFRPRCKKQLFLNALNLLLPDPLVRHDGTTTLLVTVNEQSSENRWVVHLLHYIPERRNQQIDTIEDVIPLYDVKISIKSPKIKAVRCVPEQEPLPFNQKNERVEFVLPRLVGHQMIALELYYAGFRYPRNNKRTVSVML
jgi:hypothetical protein